MGSPAPSVWRAGLRNVEGVSFLSRAQHAHRQPWYPGRCTIETSTSSCIGGPIFTSLVQCISKADPSPPVPHYKITGTLLARASCPLPQPPSLVTQKNTGTVCEAYNLQVSVTCTSQKHISSRNKCITDTREVNIPTVLNVSSSLYRDSNPRPFNEAMQSNAM